MSSIFWMEMRIRVAGPPCLDVSFNVPISSSGMRRAGVSQKRISYEKARNNKVIAAEGLQVEFTQYKYDFANALEAVSERQKKSGAIR